MKKFNFQLDSLYKVRNAQKDNLQKAYSEAETQYDDAVRKKERLEDMIEDENARYESKVRQGMPVGEMRANSAFIGDLLQRRTTAEADAERARQTAERRQQELLEAFREVKTLEKLREKQYEDYLAEEGKREKSRLEDILSFNISGKNPNIGRA
jgi:flagellar FliJ protein